MSYSQTDLSILRLCSIYSIYSITFCFAAESALRYVRDFRRVVSEKPDLSINPMCARTNYRVTTELRENGSTMLGRVDEEQQFWLSNTPLIFFFYKIDKFAYPAKFVYAYTFGCCKVTSSEFSVVYF